MHKENILITISICVSVVLCGAWYIVYTHMEHTGTAISVLRERQTSEELRMQQAKNLTLSLDAAATDSDKVTAHILAPDGEVGFIEDIEKLAKSYSLDVQVDTVGLAQATDLSAAGLEYLNLKVSVTGNWTSTYQFLSMVESMPYDIVVNQSDISLSSDGVTKGSANWQSDLDISVIKQQSPTEQD